MTTNTCKKCGCEDSFMPSPAPCPTPQGCPNPEPCSEVMDAQCVIYTGSNIICDTDIVVTTNNTVAEAIENVVDYFCTNGGGGTGPQGPQGIQGVAGPTGPQGIPGSTGGAGTTGATGPQGVQGVPGPIGPAGLNWQGVWSASGVYAADDAVGFDGASWFCINPTGPNVLSPDLDPTNWALLASEGATGPAGPTGASGVAGAAGATGPQGPAGSTGIQGIQGIPGSTGPQGPIGLTGATGATGPAGPAGTGNDVTLGFVGAGQSIVNDGVGPALFTKAITSGSGITVTGNATDIFITNIAPNVNQNLWATIAATTGSTTANTTTDTLTVVGAGGVSTSITGDTLTITGSGGGSQFTYEIGEYVPSEGGVIIHRWLSTTPYGVPDAGSIQNYIVMDSTDLSISATWGLNGILVSNCDSLWNGQSNTNQMIAAGAAIGTAAVLCNNSTNGSKTDWYLPALDELRFMEQNRFLINLNQFNFVFTPLAFNNYLSSTQISDSQVWVVSTINCIPNSTTKSSPIGVRAVRRFSI